MAISITFATAPYKAAFSEKEIIYLENPEGIYSRSLYSDMCDLTDNALRDFLQPTEKKPDGVVRICKRIKEFNRLEIAVKKIPTGKTIRVLKRIIAYAETEFKKEGEYSFIPEFKLIVETAYPDLAALDALIIFIKNVHESVSKYHREAVIVVSY